VTLSFGQDGRTVAGAAEDHTVRITDLETGNLIETLSGHVARIDAVRLSRDGRRVLSASEDGTMRVWERSSGRCVLILTGLGAGSWASQAADGQVRQTAEGWVRSAEGADR
jgi:WD40 repeat protein